MKKPKGFFTYFHHSPMINHLTDEQVEYVVKNFKEIICP